MNRNLAGVLILILPNLIFAQPSPGIPLHQDMKENIDLVAHQYTILSDSLLRSELRTADSIRTEFTLSADSLQNAYHETLSSIDAETNELNNTIDSLERLNLPTEKYRAFLNKITSRRQQVELQFSDKLKAVKARTTGKLNALELPPGYKEPLQDLAKRIDAVNMDSRIADITDLKLQGMDIPELNSMREVPGLNGIDHAGMPVTRDLEVPPDMSKISKEVEGYQQDIENIAGGDLENVEQLPETIEKQASKVDGLDELQKQSGVMDEYKTKLDDLKDPGKAKEKVVEVARQVAVDHFAGKQEQLQAAMEKLSKYKKKYGSVSSIRDLPKKRPNPMKEKPFIERVIPGLSLQYHQKNFYLLDVNLYVGYKLSGRFTTGIGWNHRFAWDSKHKMWNQRSRIFGPRSYVDFNLGKGFIAHLEGEAMNSFVPSTLRGNPDSGHREWVCSLMTGIKKEYKIYKNLKGTAIIQYNIFNRYYKAPYVDRLNSRIGFEYILRKAKKPGK